jgi:hypothetical protein
MTLDLVLPIAAAACSLLATSVISYAFGCKKGSRYERSRCLNICAGTFKEGKVSPTVQRVYRSIDDGIESLMTEKEFFG